MFIAIDIGNTHTVLGIYENERLKTDLRIPSARRNNSDSERNISELIIKERIDIKKINGIGISSVVPDLVPAYSFLSKKIFDIEPLVINSKLDLGIKLNYNNPENLGTDRICSAVAGYVKYGGPLIIIDLGTATTYGVISSTGVFLGGIITAGIATSAAALNQLTAQLPEIDLHFPDRVIGIDTISSIQSGILWGTIDAMAGMVNRLQNELQKIDTKKAAVIATGGFSEIISSRSNIIQHVEKFLVLDGIRIIYERTRG